jgi:hypothetical protein
VLQGIKKALLLHPLSQGRHSSLDDETQAPRGLPRRKKEKYFFEKVWSERKDGYLCHPEPKGSAAGRRLKKSSKNFAKKLERTKRCLPLQPRFEGMAGVTQQD